MDPQSLSAALGGWDGADGPLYRRLADALRILIRRGELPPGSRLPPERRLADELRVSRGTVVAAYTSLREEDLITSRQGSGTTVKGTAPTVHEAGPLSLETLLGMHVVQPTGVGTGFVDMQAATWDDASDLLPYMPGPDDAQLAELASGPGYHPAGIPQLRAAVADYFTARGLDTGPEQLLITCGAHQAITLLIRMCIAPGDVALTEEITYPGAPDALRAVGARVRTVRVGARGASVEDIERVLTEDRPRLVYLIPSVHNPTGTLMPTATRRRVVELARQHDTVLVDDESLVETLIDAAAPPPLASCVRDPETLSRIFTVGSASKSFWGGLRVGWIRGPEPAIAMLARLKALADLASPVQSQLACVRLLERREEVLARRREWLRERLDTLVDALSERLGEWSFRRPAGGLALWVQLPDADARAFADVAAQQGVGVIPGPTCSPGGGFTDHIRLSLGPSPAKLVEGARRLEAAWRTYRGEAGRASALEVCV